MSDSLGYRYQVLPAPVGKPQGRLAGRSFAVKDNFAIQGRPTMAGALEPVWPEPAERSADAVRALESAGAVALELVAMDELAHGFTNLNTRRTDCRNPHDPTRIAGGSSGGSAVTVAIGEVDFALATDTNGSARVPAALCGVYGVKPGHDWTSTTGLVPSAPSLDHVGVIGSSVEICRLAVEVLASASMNAESRSGRWAAVSEDQVARFATDEVRGGFDLAVGALGAVERVRLPDLEVALGHSLVITAAEFAEHHAALLDRPEEHGLAPAVREGLAAAVRMDGRRLTEAQAAREELRTEMAALWQRVDVLLLPTVPCVAPRVDQQLFASASGQTWEREPYLGVFTALFSLVGAPAISLPLQSLPPEAAGLPVGIQLVTAPSQEARLFAAAEELERRLAGTPGGEALARRPRPRLAGGRATWHEQAVSAGTTSTWPATGSRHHGAPGARLS